MCLLTYENRVLVLPRTERMLKGLYVFWLTEEETRPAHVQELLAQDGLEASFIAHLGEARHVFTHRVWQMQLLHYQLGSLPDVAWMEAHQARLVTAEELSQLPLPTAIKAARGKAMELLK